QATLSGSPKGETESLALLAPTPGGQPRDGFRLARLFICQHAPSVESRAQFARLEQMVRRLRPDAQRTLRRREGLVDDDAARRDGALQRGEQIALQVARDDDEIEPCRWQRMLREVGAPAVHADARAGRRGGRRARRRALRSAE